MRHGIIRMPNKNYRAGRRFEYETMRKYEDMGFTCVRTAGSHGPFDVIAFFCTRKPNFIQCKRVTTEYEANKAIDQFKDATVSSKYYHQTITVRIKGKEVREVTL